MADRVFTAEGRSTDTFGRVLVSSRANHFVADGPVSAGCAEEAPTPPELFLGGIAACGVELIQVIAREKGIGVEGVFARISGSIPAERIRPDVALFGNVHLHLDLRGIGDEDAAALVEAFKSR
jgi:uncharacterized OsmC-like protein